jgi:hypothetical protein
MRKNHCVRRVSRIAWPCEIGVKATQRIRKTVQLRVLNLGSLLLADRKSDKRAEAFAIAMKSSFLAKRAGALSWPNACIGHGKGQAV